MRRHPKQLQQRQREESLDPGCADDHHAYPQDASTQPRADPGGRLEILCPFRKTSAFAEKNHGKRLRGYKCFFLLFGNLLAISTGR